MTSIKDAALAYARRGWPIFPCRADKSPYTEHGVIEATTNAEQIEKWWTTWPMANIGLDVGRAGMMALDFDPGSDKAELAKALGGLPETGLRQRTPRGGEHWFYALDRDEVVSPSASKLAPHVDVRSFNSYVLLAPSRTEAGVYTWESEGRPHFRTDEMVRQSNSHRDKHKDRDTWLVPPDLTENVERAIAWLKTEARIAIEGQGGDSEAYATAAMMKSFAISEPLAFELMWEHWNPRCIPPWGDDEADHLQTKIENGYRYNTSPPGNMTPGYKAAVNAQLFKPRPQQSDGSAEECHTWTAGRFRIADRQGIDSIKPPEWLLADFLPQDAYAILFGAFGTFKTFIALDIALAIATGISNSLWADNVAQCGSVLFAVGEGRSGIAKRVCAWEQEHSYGGTADNFILMDPVPRIDEELEPFLNLAKHVAPKGYRLVVIDTIGRAMQGSDENAQKEASKFTGLVDRIRAELGCTVLAIHHTGHGATDRERGSVVFGADADTRMRVDRDGKDYTVALSVVKQKDAAEAEPRMIQLKEVDVGDQKALVAVKPDQAASPPPSDQKANGRAVRNRSMFDPKKNDDGAISQVLDDAVMEVLATNKLRRWSQSKLAQAIACREEITIGNRRVWEWLTVLREDKSTKAHKCFDSLAPRENWRYFEGTKT